MVERKICVVTGTRAEYGLLYWLIKEIEADPDLVMQLVVTGAHLSPKFGETSKVIEEDGFTIDERVDIELGKDTPWATSRSMGLGVIGMAGAYQRLAPDIVVLLGDRYEILAAAEAAMVARIPIAHIHGGEVTEGAFDDSIRHAVTKMAHIHFTATEAYRRRVIQLGEDPAMVFAVGAPGLDAVEKTSFLSKEELETALGRSLGDAFLLVTYHPQTAGADDPARGAGELAKALDRFPDFGILITGVNADPGHRSVTRVLDDLVQRHPDRASLQASLGQQRYLSAMKHCAAVVGNSSSGIIEAPALKVPTVNVGSRQKGRVRGPSVIDCEAAADTIEAAITKAVGPAFGEAARTAPSPYGGGGASARIKEHLKSVDLSGIMTKKFRDIPMETAHA